MSYIPVLKVAIQVVNQVLADLEEAMAEKLNEPIAEGSDNDKATVIDLRIESYILMLSTMIGYLIKVATTISLSVDDKKWLGEQVATIERSGLITQVSGIESYGKAVDKSLQSLLHLLG